MYTYQDFMKDSARGGLSLAIDTLITRHKATPEYRIAVDADLYDSQRNSTISNVTKFIYSANGIKEIDTLSANNRLCSNFFRRLNTQRNMYSLGNGVFFDDNSIKERLGLDFDTKMKTAGYYALIHGISFIFYNLDHVHVFPLTEFAPLWDEETGALRAGVRFWRIDYKKPVMAVLYEEDGYTKFKKDPEVDSSFVEIESKRAYRMKVAETKAGDIEVVAEENYTKLPIVPLYGSRLKQSTLVGMKAKIDAFDLVRSGFANDLQDCSEIYWTISNAGGMTQKDMSKFLNRLRNQHVVAVDSSDDAKVTPYTQEIPVNARKTFLDDIRSQIYEDFGALDVHTISAGATNDHIDAGYQPLDENADDYEFQLIDAIQSLLSLIGIEATPFFKRNRISNQKEMVDMVMECASVLDEETILSKLPFITFDEVQEILKRKDEKAIATWETGENAPKDTNKGDTEEDLEE